MKNPKTSCIPSRGVRKGFALVVSLTMMVLLTIIAVGLLSLSAVTLRTSDQTSAKAIAEANARLAMMIAIGELQKQMGPDQRISANAEILSMNETGAEATVRNPKWLGVWDSWIAGPIPDTVNENYPSAESHHQTIWESGFDDDSMKPSYDKDRHFRRWLVSMGDDLNTLGTARTLDSQTSQVPDASSTFVRLVGDYSTSGGATEHVNVSLIPVHDDTNSQARGRYGWWIGDESQKANVLEDSYKSTRPVDLADRLTRQQAPASLGNSVIDGLQNLGNQSALSFLPSRNSLALVNGSTPQIMEQFHHITHRSYAVLADVREGGLKRDLSTLLERPIDPDEVYNFTNVEDFRRPVSLKTGGEDFMLYRFDDMIQNTYNGTTGQAAVPIHDLAAYYQLYNSYDSESMGGIQYSSSESSPSSNLLRNGIMVSNPDYGVTGTDLDKYLRQYTSLYRNPVLVKIEVILSYTTELRSREELQAEMDAGNPNPDRYRLQIGITPAATFWNPNNVPLVMNIGDPNLYSYRLRERAMPLQLRFYKLNAPNEERIGSPDNQVEFSRITSTNQGELYTLYISGNYPAIFEPGESKVFALSFASNTDAGSASNSVNFLNRGAGVVENFMPECELVPGWNPNKFIKPVITGRSPGTLRNGVFTFDVDDYIAVDVLVGNNNTFDLSSTQQSRTKRSLPATKYHFRSNTAFMSRFNADQNYRNQIMFKGFPLNGAPGIVDETARAIEIPARLGQNLVNAMRNPFNPRDDLPQAFFYYALKAGTETHESNHNAGADGTGRRFPSRPFLHSTAMSPCFLDSTDSSSFYTYGWNWFFMPLDNINDAPVEISNFNSGYYAGGYTAENGVTHAVQQQLPLTPPISIATLSHAHLGGFSVATEAVADGYNGLGDRAGRTDRFRRTTATGWGGLAPHTLQAIGNSYAHPNIPADKAFSTWRRLFQQNYPAAEVPFADHSYLSNKSLWDDFFFSSMSPRPREVKIFTDPKTTSEVAREFFFGGKSLHNPRIIPYLSNIDESKLEDLLAEYDEFKDGFADKIGAHLMVEGPFNINSTSVSAWKALFSSLKGQDVTYLDAKSALVVGTNLDFEKIDGVPLPGGPLPNGKAFQGSSSDPSDRNQWTGYRVLTDQEIEELAEAMVKQVKMRGPFLSLSEFVNRRLDARASATELALKGALQAAIDDPNVSINEGFRQAPRLFTAGEKSFMSAEFPAAMEGPVAYGSSAYVDQADILRNFPAQLTPRGDTFVIRTYGDALDNAGNVMARAWCEAIVQRTPAYADPADSPETKQADLSSESNRNFGRKFQITSFRWLNPSEI
jgi:hypothetical protein